MKFKYDCFNNRLWKFKDEYASEIPEQQAFVDTHGERKFVLDTDCPNHWINFTVYDRVIRVFYKQISKVGGNDITTYYQKDISRDGDFVVEFELTKADIVAKRDDGRRAKKS
jgi:hypothetical protein